MIDVWVLVGALCILALSAAYIGWRALRRTRWWWRATAALVAGLLVGYGTTYAWARVTIDRTTFARTVVWMEADVDDWQRFPAAPVPAGERTLLLREGAPRDDALEEVTLPDDSTVRLEQLLEETQTTSFLVLRGDRLLVEEYPLGGERNDVVTSFSVAKSILSTVLGIAIDRGDVGSVDDPITDYVPELLDKDERFSRITLRHLLTMSSGLRYEEQGTPWSDDAKTYYSPDLRATALSVEIVEPPGIRWHYNNYNPLLIGLALERATGQPLADYTSRHLWQPMGAAYDASWSIDSERHGFAKMESGFNARPIDFARFGHLVAHQGGSDGRQVVSASWIADATARRGGADPAGFYQWFWWVDTERPDRFFASGNKGQYIYVDPVTEVVVVRTGRDRGIDDWPAVLRDVADRVAAAPS